MQPSTAPGRGRMHIGLPILAVARFRAGMAGKGHQETASSFGASTDSGRFDAPAPRKVELISRRIRQWPETYTTRLTSRLCYVHDMCGRARRSSDVSEIKLVFSIPPERPTPNFSAKLERGADRHPSRRALRHQGRRAQPRQDALGAWCPTGRRTSRSALPTSTPRPKGSEANLLSARRSGVGASHSTDEQHEDQPRW
jgi:hypothetical protein